MAAPAQLLPGDRLPDVRLRPADGDATALHRDFAGEPLWLVVAGADDDAPGNLPTPPAGVTALWITAPRTGEQAHRDPPAGWRALAADPRWCALLDRDVLWQADANLRLRRRDALPVATPPPAPSAPEPLQPSQTGLIAPVLQIPDVFEPDLCAALIRHLDRDCGGGEPSGVLVVDQGGERIQVDPTIKQRRESPPRDPELEARMHERLLRRALPEVARIYQFQVARRDPFKLLAYPADAGYFRAHRDNETPDVAYRRFALSINLNAGDYDGGEFRYPEFGPHRFSPATGTALVFSCGLLHEVLPVQRGTRYAMTTFLA